ncbi:hypothetical protein BY458DRAFT_492966 [Sporodiniella umbellata]|nr:hypothetical protein BY458DRAFT_492966 [Sporodiniella umbellata]
MFIKGSQGLHEYNIPVTVRLHNLHASAVKLMTFEVVVHGALDVLFLPYEYRNYVLIVEILYQINDWRVALKKINPLVSSKIDTNYVTDAPSNQVSIKCFNYDLVQGPRQKELNYPIVSIELYIFLDDSASDSPFMERFRHTVAKESSQVL